MRDLSNHGDKRMTTDAEELLVPRWRKAALAICMFLITASFGFLQPFVPLYMEASGLTRSRIGLVTGFGTALALLIQPVLGKLSDRLDTRRPLMFASALAAGVAYSCYRFAHSPLEFMLLSAVGVNGTIYLNAAGGVLVGRMVGSRRGGSAYARYRVWGSVGYIVVALLTGWLLYRHTASHAAMTRMLLEPVFLYGPWLFAIIATACMFVPDVPTEPSGATNNQRRGSPAPSAELDRRVRPFLLSFFFYQFALYGASAYLSLFMKELGASPLWITATFATGVVCEVLVMTQVGRLADLYGRKPILTIAFTIMPLRLLCYIPATGPVWVMAVQSLHGLNFGIMGAIAIVFINDLATNQDRGAAQARLAAVGGLATALGPAACGWLAQHWGIGSMFAAMAGVGSVGAAIFLARVQESHPAPANPIERAPAALRPILRRLWRRIA